MCEMVERGRERRLLKRLARLRRLAIEQECCREAGHVLQFGEFLRCKACLAAGDDVALRAGADRGRKQVGEGNTPAMSFGGFERQHPARDRARHRECCERSARRDRFVLAIEFRTGIGASATRRHQRADAAGRLAHEPEAVAADVVHVRIDGGDHRRHRHHGLERIAAFGERGASGLDGCGMRRADDALAVAGGVEVHRGDVVPQTRYAPSPGLERGLGDSRQTEILSWSPSR